MEHMLTSSKSKISTWQRVEHTQDTLSSHQASLLLAEAKLWSFKLWCFWREPGKTWPLLRTASHTCSTQVRCPETASHCGRYLPAVLSGSSLLDLCWGKAVGQLRIPSCLNCQQYWKASLGPSGVPLLWHVPMSRISGMDLMWESCREAGDWGALQGIPGSSLGTRFLACSWAHRLQWAASWGFHPGLSSEHSFGGERRKQKVCISARRNFPTIVLGHTLFAARSHYHRRAHQSIKLQCTLSLLNSEDVFHTDTLGWRIKLHSISGLRSYHSKHFYMKMKFEN